MLACNYIADPMKKETVPNLLRQKFKLQHVIQSLQIQFNWKEKYVFLHINSAMALQNP